MEAAHGEAGRADAAHVGACDGSAAATATVPVWTGSSNEDEEAGGGAGGRRWRRKAVERLECSGGAWRLWVARVGAMDLLWRF